MVRGLLLLLLALGPAALVCADEGVAVNVNRADVRQLASALSGVGEKKAEAIVAYREQHGPFRTLEDLARVKGIGHKLVERNRERIRFEGAALGEGQAPEEGISRLRLPVGAYAPY